MNRKVQDVAKDLAGSVEGGFSQRALRYAWVGGAFFCDMSGVSAAGSLDRLPAGAASPSPIAEGVLQFS